MTARLGSSAHTKMLIYIQGWSCFCYVCIKKQEIKKKKDIHLVQSRRRLVRVRACICLHLCMSYLCVHLRHWAAGYAALKGCVSAAIPLSLSLFPALCLSLTLGLPYLFCLPSVSFTITVLSICIPLSMLYHNCR